MASRLQDVRRRRGATYEALALGTGIPIVTIKRIFAGTAVPAEDRLDAILVELGATHADLADPEASEVVAVPVYDIEVAAGPGRFLTDEEPIGSWPFPRDWAARMFGPDVDLAVVGVAGDSQEPELRNGDSVLIDLRRNRPREGMHVVRVGQALLIKRLQLEGGRVRLLSNNAAYDDQIVDLSEGPSQFQVIGQALWALKRL